MVVLCTFFVFQQFVGQVCCKFSKRASREKKSENRLRFDRIMATSSWLHFFWPTLYRRLYRKCRAMCSGLLRQRRGTDSDIVWKYRDIPIRRVTVCLRLHNSRLYIKSVFECVGANRRTCHQNKRLAEVNTYNYSVRFVRLLIHQPTGCESAARFTKHLTICRTIISSLSCYRLVIVTYSVTRFFLGISRANVRTLCQTILRFCK